MLSGLPPPVAAYFEASNAQDAEALVSLFADDASVRDEGEVMVGLAAIRGWATATFRKYRMTLVPRRRSESGDVTAVIVEVSGSFPGSPIELGFRFRVAAGKIAELQIG